MKKFVFLIVLLCVMPVAVASSLFEDWVEDGQTFQAGDHSFYVKYIEAKQKVTFKMDGTGGMLLAGECETREDITYCFQEVNYPKIKVKISSEEPDISIERSFSTTAPNLDERITVSVTLKNNGNKGATNVKYTDPYPIGLKVFSDKNAGEWQGSLNSGVEEKFTYAVKAEEIVSFDSTATLSYKFGDNEKTKKSTAVTINVQKPFDINDKLSTEKAEKNEIVTYNLTIYNENEATKLSVENLEISLPEQIDLVSAPSQLKNDKTKLTFKGTIESKESKNFAIKVKSSRVGEFKISTLAEIKAGARTFKEE